MESVQPQHVELVVHGCCRGVVGTVLRRELLDAGAVHGSRVGEDSAHHVPTGQFVVFGHLMQHRTLAMPEMPSQESRERVSSSTPASVPRYGGPAGSLKSAGGVGNPHRRWQ